MYSDERAVRILRSTFGYNNFKDKIQRKIVRRLSKGKKNIVLSMPTEFGKSLCIQLATIMTDGKLSIIFSPKYFITKREVAYLQSKGISAAFLNKEISKSAANKILIDLESENPTIRLLYCAPEYLTDIRFQDVVTTLKKRSKVFYIVYDEACSLTQWGFDKLLYYRNSLRDIELYCYLPNLILTRCITSQAIGDACKILNLRHADIFSMPGTKTDIYYDVHFTELLEDSIGHLKHFLLTTLSSNCNNLTKEQREIAVIYCKNMEVGHALSNRLKDYGISTVLFTRRMKEVYFNETNWLPSDCNVLITVHNLKFCSQTFVRSVVYWSVPLSVAKYYNESQETYKSEGIAYSRIYFGRQEYSAIAQNIAKKIERNERIHFKGELQEFKEVANYCLSIKCRHVLFGEYFGAAYTSCKKYCDICSDPSVSIKIIAFLNSPWQVGLVDSTVLDIFQIRKFKNAKKMQENLLSDVSTDYKYQSENALPNSTEKILVNSKCDSSDNANGSSQSKLLSSELNSTKTELKIDFNDSSTAKQETKECSSHNTVQSKLFSSELNSTETELKIDFNDSSTAKQETNECSLHNTVQSKLFSSELNSTETELKIDFNDSSTAKQETNECSSHNTVQSKLLASELNSTETELKIDLNDSSTAKQKTKECSSRNTVQSKLLASELNSTETELKIDLNDSSTAKQETNECSSHNTVQSKLFSSELNSTETELKIDFNDSSTAKQETNECSLHNTVQSKLFSSELNSTETELKIDFNDSSTAKQETNECSSHNTVQSKLLASELNSTETELKIDLNDSSTAKQKTNECSSHNTVQSKLLASELNSTETELKIDLNDSSTAKQKTNECSSHNTVQSKLLASELNSTETELKIDFNDSSTAKQEANECSSHNTVQSKLFSSELNSTETELKIDLNDSSTAKQKTNECSSPNTVQSKLLASELNSTETELKIDLNDSSTAKQKTNECSSHNTVQSKLFTSELNSTKTELKIGLNDSSTAKQETNECSSHNTVQSKLLASELNSTETELKIDLNDSSTAKQKTNECSSHNIVQSKLFTSELNSTKTELKIGLNDSSTAKQKTNIQDTIPRTGANLEISESRAKRRKLNDVIVTSEAFTSLEISSITKENDKVVPSEFSGRYSPSLLSSTFKYQNSSDECEVVFIQEIKRTPKSKKRKRRMKKQVVEDKPEPRERVNKNKATADKIRQKTSVERVENSKSAGKSNMDTIQNLMKKFNLDPNVITMTYNPVFKRGNSN